MKDALIKLLKVESLITLTLVSAATYGFLTGIVPVELFATWVGGVITYFFQRNKNGA